MLHMSIICCSVLKVSETAYTLKHKTQVVSYVGIWNIRVVYPVVVCIKSETVLSFKIS